MDRAPCEQHATGFCSVALDDGVNFVRLLGDDVVCEVMSFFACSELGTWF